METLGVVIVQGGCPVEGGPALDVSQATVGPSPLHQGLQGSPVVVMTRPVDRCGLICEKNRYDLI